jgi:hypothetical protein
MTNIEYIIKKTLKAQLKELKKNNRGVINEAVDTTFKTYKQPNGSSLLIPDDIYINHNEYQKTAWLLDLTNVEKVKANYKNYVSSDNDVFAKTCNDEFTKLKLEEFNKSWASKYIKILSLNSTTLYPPDLTKDEGMVYWFTNKKLHEKFGDGLKAENFMGTDYYFKKFSEWLMSSEKTTTVKVEKGNVTALNNFPISKIMGVSETEKPAYLKSDTTEITLPDSLGGGTVSANSVETSWFDWSITKNSFCETSGSMQWYQQTMIYLVNSVIESSVSEFAVSGPGFKKYVENLGEKYSEYVKDLSSFDRSEVVFSACFKRNISSSSVGSISYDFLGYFDDVKEVDNEYACSGNKYPGLAVFLASGDKTMLDTKTGMLFTESQNIVEIPLLSVSVNSIGKPWKYKTKRLKEKTTGVSDNNSDMYSIPGVGAIMAIYDNASEITNALQFTWNMVQGDYSEAMDVAGKKMSGIDPSLIDRKENFSMATPLIIGTKGLFKKEDYIDHQKVNEDTEAFAIPKGGLSQYIPGAKKHSKWNVVSKNGEYLYRYYVVDYYNPITGLEQELPLPTSEWWDGYSKSFKDIKTGFNEIFYKLSNVVSDSMMNESKVNVALCLVIKGGDGFANVIQTRGSLGWTFKIDTGTGCMYFAEGEEITKEVNGRTITYGFNNSNKTYGLPGELQTYNFYDNKFLDSRSAVGQFWDSHISTFVQIVVGIAIGVVAAPVAEGIAIGMGWARGAAVTYEVIAAEGTAGYWFASQVGTAFIHSRLAVIVEIVADLSILTGPQAVYYFRNGDNLGGILCLLTAFIPIVVERTSVQFWSKTIWSDAVAKSLTEKMGKQSVGFWGSLTSEKLFGFLGGLSRQESMAFGELLEQVTKNGDKAINDIFKEFTPVIKEVLSGSKELQKIVSKGLLGNLKVFARMAAPVAGGIFIFQTTVKYIVEKIRAKKPDVTEEEIQRLTEGLFKLSEKISTEVNFWEKEQERLKLINPLITVKSFDKWIEENGEELQDTFFMLCEKNGWENLVNQGGDKKISDGYANDTKEQIKDHPEDVVIAVIEDEFAYLEMIDEIIIESSEEYITGEISESSQIQDKISIITEYYRCISDEALFKFQSAHKTSTGYWWICYRVLAGNTLKNGVLYFMGKNSSLDYEKLGGFVSKTWSSNRTDVFHTEFQNCKNYTYVNKPESSMIYKKMTDGKIFQSKKNPISWLEVTDTKQKQEIEDKYFK